MKRTRTVLLCAGLLSAAALWLPATAGAEVNINITIPLPGLVFPGPPALVVIPGTNAYYPPDVEAQIFFYHGSWYRPYGGRWYISVDYNGPWRFIVGGRVPPVLRDMPPGYRRGPYGYERVPYGEVRRNWRTWERERYWEHRDRREYRRDERREDHEDGGRGRGGRRERGDD